MGGDDARMQAAALRCASVPVKELRVQLPRAQALSDCFLRFAWRTETRRFYPGWLCRRLDNADHCVCDKL